MKKYVHIRIKMIQILSVIILIIGVIFQIYMITVEDEPGALPMVLLIIGTIGFVRTRNALKNII